MIGLYTLLEKFDEGENIYNIYEDDSTFMKFPLAIMYYKKGDYRKAKKILKKVQESNEYILGYLTQKIKLSETKIEMIEADGTYSWGSIAEAYFVIKDFKYLLDTVPDFVDFIFREIK